MIVGTRGERIIGWKAIADALGLNVDAAKKRLHRAGLAFPKLYPEAANSPVYTTPAMVRLLRGRLC